MLLLFVLANFVVAAVGARLGERGPGTEVWFASLRKPPGYPQDWIFAPLWTLVAIATGVAGWWIWRQSALTGDNSTLVLYGFLLLFNAAWQGVALGLRRLGLALGVAWLLWATINLTMALASRGGMGWLWLLPYWLWVGYCLRLNHQLWHCNRDAPAGEQVC
ncbi:MAG: TspO/MBR family protein [Terriglobales bacterium]